MKHTEEAEKRAKEIYGWTDDTSVTMGIVQLREVYVRGYCEAMESKDTLLKEMAEALRSLRSEYARSVDWENGYGKQEIERADQTLTKYQQLNKE